MQGYERAAQEWERSLDSGGDICEPKVISRFRNEDGMDDGEMNCQYCDNKECEYWEEYN